MSISSEIRAQIGKVVQTSGEYVAKTGDGYEACAVGCLIVNRGLAEAYLHTRSRPSDFIHENLRDLPLEQGVDDNAGGRTDVEHMLYLLNDEFNWPLEDICEWLEARGF